MQHIVRKTHPHAIPVAITVEAWSLIAGMFFTSVLTTAPAIVSLGELGQHIAPWKVALFGGAGAVCGDIFLFRFLHSPLANYIIRAAVNLRWRRLGAALERSFLWWIVPLIGALVIASPLPDELGLLMMGLSGMRLWSFVLLAYVMNVVGIYIIAITALAIAG